jgi:polyisoprenoid-binding protein YceI
MKWNIDTSHTSVNLAVRHMGLATVRGRFGKVQGTVEVENGRLVGIDATIAADSIDTGDAQRDGHLRSPDFLDVESYPVITFRSTAVKPLRDGRYEVTGDLTIRDQARPVKIEVEASQPMVDPWGNQRAGATATGTLNRKDWGLTWNKVLELGTLLVGEEIRLSIDVEAVAPPVAVAA